MAAKKPPTSKKKPPKAIANTNELSVDPRNPRTITDTAATGLSASLNEFGDLSGIVFNTRTGQLVCGHQRLGQIRKRWGELPIDGNVIRTPEGHEFAVRFVDWSVEKQKAANVAANSSAIAGEFTDELDLILAELREETPDLYGALLFNELELAAAAEPAADRSDEVSELVRFNVIVECVNEADQVALIEQLTKDGKKCRALNA